MAEPTTQEKKAFAAKGWAMPDGSFYIRPDYPEDLTNAIKAVGRATPNAGESDVARRNAVRRYIIKRAAELKRSNEIPDTWNSDGSLKHDAMIDEFLLHFGRKGMKWGQHIFSKGPSAAAHPDSARATSLHTQAKKTGTHTLSNEELQTVITRRNLEQQYSRLDQNEVAKGRQFFKDRVGDVKMTLDAIDTGRRVYEAVSDAQKLLKK